VLETLRFVFETVLDVTNRQPQRKRIKTIKLIIIKYLYLSKYHVTNLINGHMRTGITINYYYYIEY